MMSNLNVIFVISATTGHRRVADHARADRQTDTLQGRRLGSDDLRGAQLGRPHSIVENGKQGSTQLEGADRGRVPDHGRQEIRGFTRQR